jgi:phage major head subunit gpT-like protein
MAISENWGELLEPGLRSIFETTFSELSQASRIPMLFNVIPSAKAAEHFLGVGGMADWEEYHGRIEYDDTEQGFKTTLTHQEFVKGFKVERRLYEDDQYSIINPRPRSLARTAVRTREKHGASIFNNAFSSSYLGGDGVALCSASHPYSPSNATVQSNAGTTAFSYDAVVSTRRLMREYKDDRGEIVAINPNLILVPPELEEPAFRVVRTMREREAQVPDTSDYAASPIGEWGIDALVWDYLTDPNDWFMLDKQLAKEFLLWINRVLAEFAMDPTGDYTLEQRFRGYMRYSYGWSDWRWIYGHEVS